MCIMYSLYFISTHNMYFCFCFVLFIFIWQLTDHALVLNDIVCTFERMTVHRELVRLSKYFTGVSDITVSGLAMNI